MPARADLLQGTLDLLILRTLALGALHGWGISKRISQLSSDVLYRLEERGWIEAEWGVSDEGRRAKFYALTREGRKQLAAERAQWKLFTAAVEQVLEG